MTRPTAEVREEVARILKRYLPFIAKDRGYARVCVNDLSFVEGVAEVDIVGGSIVVHLKDEHRDPVVQEVFEV